MDRAVLAVVIDLQVSTIAGRSSRRTTGRGRDDGVADDAGGIVRSHRNGSGHRERRSLVRLIDKGAGIGAHHIAGQHQAGGGACAVAARLVAGVGRQRGMHVGQDLEVAAQRKFHRIGLGQHDQRIFIANLGANQGVDGLVQHVLRSPAHGVKGQCGADSGTARAHGGRVGGRDVGDVVGLNGEAAIGLDMAQAQDRAAGAQHDVVGNQCIEGHGRGGCATGLGRGAGGAARKG